MAGVDYRSLQGPESVNTDLPDNGAAARAQALGSLFKEFEGVSADVYAKAQTQAGALAGAAAGATGHPQYREGLARFTAYSQAFNNAATGAYAIQAQSQADAAAARLRVSANGDPNTFRTTFSAVRDAVLKEAPAEAQPMLTELYNKHLAAGIGDITGQQAAEERTKQQQIYDFGIQNQVSRVAALMSTGDPKDAAAAADEQTKLSLMINGSVNAGLHTQAEADALHSTTMRAVTEQVFSTQVDRELADPNGNVALLLDNFRAAHVANLADTSKPAILSEPEYQKLYADGIQKVKEWSLLQALTRRDTKTEEQLRFEAGDVKYTNLFLTGKLNDRMLAQATLTGDLKPERATSLHTQLEIGVTAKSDPVAYLKALRDPNLLKMTPEEIANIPGVSRGDQIKLGVEADRQRNNWEGTEAGKQGKAAIDATLKIPPGVPRASLSDAQVRAQDDAHQEYTQLMNSTPPEQRTAMAATNAQIAIKNVQRREAQEDVTALSLAKERTLKAHGPGSADEWSKDKMDAYIKNKDTQISASAAKAKGP